MKNKIVEYGDYQTPKILVEEIFNKLTYLKVKPSTIIEPSCGVGNFINQGIERFKNLKIIIGVDVNSDYLKKIKKNEKIKLITSNFFSLDWEKVLKFTKGNILILGNPPWVTNSKLGKLNSNNLPKKENFQKNKGFDAMTGKSNFDISEWMSIKNLEWLQNYEGYLMVICKTSIARKLVKYAFKNNKKIYNAKIFKIDSKKYFNVNVQACVLYFDTLDKSPQKFQIYNDLTSIKSDYSIEYFKGNLIKSNSNKKLLNYLYSVDNVYKWRSGIKHDCSKIMELKKIKSNFYNGYGKKVKIEEKYIYPLIKSSNLMNEKKENNNFLIVTQKKIGQSTNKIKEESPKLWEYLNKNIEDFNKRKSVIYKNQPSFSIFGVGDYSFAPWKIAISGLSKKLDFKLIGTQSKKPFMLDDTTNFLYFNSKNEAKIILKILLSKKVQNFLKSFIFWDEKRPITISILQKLNISKLINKI